MEHALIVQPTWVVLAVHLLMPADKHKQMARFNVMVPALLPHQPILLDMETLVLHQLMPADRQVQARFNVTVHVQP